MTALSLVASATPFITVASEQRWNANALARISRNPAEFPPETSEYPIAAGIANTIPITKIVAHMPAACPNASPHDIVSPLVSFELAPNRARGLSVPDHRVPNRISGAGGCQSGKAALSRGSPSP